MLCLNISKNKFYLLEINNMKEGLELLYPL